MKTTKALVVMTMGAVLFGCMTAEESAKPSAGDEFVSLFDGKTLNGWKVRGGYAKYCVEDGVIKGEGVPGTPGNTFLTTEKEYENFIFKAEFLCEGGNSGIQFRSSERPTKDPAHGRVYGYQSEITVNGSSCGRIYDEGRRGHKLGIVWLDLSTPKDRLSAAEKALHRGGWNRMEIQCVGPSIKTWVNGVKVADILDDCQFKGFFGLQIHAQSKKNADGTPMKPGVCRWRNLSVLELPSTGTWKKFFVEGVDGKMAVDGAKYVFPQDWSFVGKGKDAYLRGIHDKAEKKDGLVISTADYDDFIARVTYRLNGGNSALYYRAAEEDVPWVLKGFQNEIAGNEKDSALWHTRGKVSKGRGWVMRNDELVRKVRATNDWNTVCTIAVGKRLVHRLNGFETFDIVDPQAETTGKLGLQLHGGADNEMRFKDWEVLPIRRELLPYFFR